MSEDNQESSSVKVVDKRRFNPDGTEKGESPEVPIPEDAIKSSFQGEVQSEEEVSGLHDMNFANFILSLAGSAQMSLGVSPNPFTQKIEKDLLQAKQTIDLIGMLADKTKGNLSPEEASLLKVVLSDLRMRYVEENKK